MADAGAAGRVFRTQSHGDGIPAAELVAGAHTLIRTDQAACSLFVANLGRNLPQLLLALAVPFLGRWGRARRRHGVAAATRFGREGERRPAREN